MVGATGEPEAGATGAQASQRDDASRPAETGAGSATGSTGNPATGTSASNGSANGHALGGEVLAAVATAKDKVVAGAADVRRIAVDVAHSPQVVTASEKTREVAGKAAATVKEKVAANPAVSAAADKTVAAKDAALGTVKAKAGEHPQVAAVAERAASTSGKALRDVGHQAKRHPRAVRRAAVGVVVLVLVRRLRRRR